MCDNEECVDDIHEGLIISEEGIENNFEEYQDVMITWRTINGFTTYLKRHPHMLEMVDFHLIVERFPEEVMLFSLKLDVDR